MVKSNPKQSIIKSEAKMKIDGLNAGLICGLFVLFGMVLIRIIVG